MRSSRNPCPQSAIRHVIEAEPSPRLEGIKDVLNRIWRHPQTQIDLLMPRLWKSTTGASNSSSPPFEMGLFSGCGRYLRSKFDVSSIKKPLLYH